MKIPIHHLRDHTNKRKTSFRFLLALSLLITYTIYLILQYGESGFYLGVITWSAFVIATPIADAGFLLDFPVRLITGLRMIYSEAMVWIIAILVNIYFFTTNPEIYHQTKITHILNIIISNPWPDWIIIIVSFLGTFLSMYFGDELLDSIFHHERKKYFRHRKWYRIIIAVFGLLLIYFLYKNFLNLFGIDI